MSRQARLWTGAVACWLCAAPLQATSPLQPIEAELKPAPEARASKGKHVLRLRVWSRDKKELSLEIRGQSALLTPGRTEAQPELRRLGRTQPQQDFILEHEVALGPDEVLHQHYEIEVRSKTGQRPLVLVVDQAFALDSEGRLQPIGFAEEMQRTSKNPLPGSVRGGARPAGDIHPRPLQ